MNKKRKKISTRPNIISKFLCWGLSNDKLHDIRQGLYQSNLKNSILINVLDIIYYLIACIASILDKQLFDKQHGYYRMIFASVILLSIALVMYKKKSKNYFLINVISYISIILVLTGGIFLGITNVNTPTVLFHVFLIAAQIVFLIHPIISVLLSISSSTVLIVLSYNMKSIDIFRIDLLNTVIVCSMSIVLGWIESRIIINEKLSQHQLKKWGNDVFFRSHEDYRDITKQALTTLAHTIDAKDKYTNGHSIRVALYSREIARRIGMSPEEQENIYYGALLHDIGKIGVPDAILNKSDKLTNEEYDLIKQHTIYGAKILKDFNAIAGITDGALYHHERIDGKGYSSRLQGNKIPPIAKIVSVADTYDALTSNRRYRGAFDEEKAIEILEEVSGSQLDERYTSIMIKMIKDGFTQKAKQVE